MSTFSCNFHDDLNKVGPVRVKVYVDSVTGSVVKMFVLVVSLSLN